MVFAGYGATACTYPTTATCVGDAGVAIKALGTPTESGGFTRMAWYVGTVTSTAKVRTITLKYTAYPSAAAAAGNEVHNVAAAYWNSTSTKKRRRDRDNHHPDQDDIQGCGVHIRLDTGNDTSAGRRPRPRRDKDHVNGHASSRYPFLPQVTVKNANTAHASTAYDSQSSTHSHWPRLRGDSHLYGDRYLDGHDGDWAYEDHLDLSRRDLIGQGSQRRHHLPSGAGGVVHVDQDTDPDQ